MVTTNMMLENTAYKMLEKESIFASFHQCYTFIYYAFNMTPRQILIIKLMTGSFWSILPCAWPSVSSQLKINKCNYNTKLESCIVILVSSHSNYFTLTHFNPMFPFYTLWKHQKRAKKGSVKREYWPEFIQNIQNVCIERVSQC